MSRPDFDVVERYTGTGNLSDYTFDFKIEALSQLLVVVTNASDVELQRVRGTDTVYLSSVDFDGVKGGGVVHLLADLPTNYKMGIFLANDAPTQPFEFKDKFVSKLDYLERAFDFLAGAVQRLAFFSNRTIRINDMYTGSFNPELPADLEPNRVMMVAPDGNSFVQGPTPEELAQASGDAAAAGDAGDAAAAAQAAAEAAQAAAEAASIVAQNAAIAAAASADELDPTQYGYAGFSARFGELMDTADLGATLLYILNLQYAAPAVSFSASGSGSLREKGTAVTSSTLGVTVTKKSDPIAAIRYYIGASLLHTNSSPSPTGGSDSYSWTGSFSDNTTFNVQVDDDGTSNGGIHQTVNGSSSFSFVYPYYHGAGAAGKTAAQVAALTKEVISSTATKAESFTASASDVFYFAYPASYGNLTSILDVNNFETIGDWTKTTSNITGLDGNAVSYNIYAFNNPVVAGSYTYTFKR